MLINGVELKNLGVELYDRVLYSNDIDTREEWLDGDIQPTFIRQQDKFKNLKLDFLVLCADEEEAFKRISTLTASLKKATIKFDDLNFTFDVSIIEVNEPTRLKNGNFIVSYLLSSGYAKGQREVYTTNANMTNSFKLTLTYYKDKTQLLSNETIVIRASSFNKPNMSLKELGIDTNKYLPKYYNEGIITNLGGADITYENLQNLQVLIINYEPISYNLNVKYFMDNGEGLYNELLTRTVSFTQPSLKNYLTIGQLVNVSDYRPEGYRGRVNYDGALTVEELLLVSSISVFYDKVEMERSKNVILAYKKENDDGSFETIKSVLISVKESQFYDGLTLKDLVQINAYQPNSSFYNEGYIRDHSLDELISFDSIETAYSIEYTKSVNTIYVEYYAGVYPDWRRLSTVSLNTKYRESYMTSFDVIKDLNIDINKYHTAPYEDGVLYNLDAYPSYEAVINAGVLQIFYPPINYPITINYYTGDLQVEPVVEEISINATMFFDNPVLGDIIPIQAHRPDGYQFSLAMSYAGEVSLEALTQASPILIVYEEIAVSKTKNVIIKYKKELSSTYSTLATNLITVSEADCIGGVRLKDIISLNAYKPEYYEDGVLDGASSTALIQYDDILANYEVMYLAKPYTTPVRYYLDEINDLHWVGSSSISYRIIDFTTETTLYDFGLDLNAFKGANTSDGVLQYTGPVNFTSLLDQSAINVLYTTKEAPPDPETTNYPHRFLFLQHNDLGAYENLHPEWTMNHAFINTGISADDMSKLTVVMECERVDENVPLHKVNANEAYLFGSSSGLGQYYMRFNNQTMYGEGLTGVNLYEAKAGKDSDVLILTEKNAIGFSENSGIYSSPQAGYSRAVFTYSNVLATDNAPMPYPLYLFANNNNGSYQGGLAGVGIYSCRIYYNDQLIRDFIPVSYYDKIGDLVAPSNCLYDKITNSFFEDATGLNSFNIRDDDRYQDDDPAHKIGHCYVNYYKGDQPLSTAMIWFRGDDFTDDKAFDLYEKFFVDDRQPQYTYAGKIENEDQIVVSFDGLNNKNFKVVYEPIETQIEVNYFKEEADGTQQLLKQEVIPLREEDFYQAPTFGDLVRLNKYKPEGYETDFKYTGRKVSLTRVVEGSPYKIVYKPMAEPAKEYTTAIVYKKKIYGVRNYETIGTDILKLDQSNFRDGEYIDFYIDKNKYKPEKYYVDGATYRWFEMDERLTVPTDLKNQYEIVYQPQRQFIDVNYYRDSVNETNIVATDTWSLQIDDLDPRLTYSIVDILPNEYVNKYKPIICNGGMIQGATVQHTFETLLALPEIAIVYETIVEPHDPEEAYYEPKVLGFGTFNEKIYDIHRIANNIGDFIGGKIPYIDLGYRPKEIGRLKVEIKGVAEADTFLSSTCHGGFQDLGYNKWFGYSVPRSEKNLGIKPKKENPGENDLGGMYGTLDAPWNRGHYSIGTYIASASGWVYTAEGPQYIDGQTLYRAGDSIGVISGSPKQRYYGHDASYQKGAGHILDENYEEITCYKAYRRMNKLEMRNSSGDISVIWNPNIERISGIASGYAPQLANPMTTVMDAYHNYYASWTNENSNHPEYEFYEDKDLDVFEARLQPRGSLSLFQSTNPLTGKVNLMPFKITTAPNASGFPMALTGKYNPYEGSIAEIERDIIVQTGTDENNNPIFEHRTEKVNIKYADFNIDVFPQLRAGAVWSIKIWDRDRLVRDMIPVSKGQKVFDYEMPENGLFDLITEIFFGNSNKGGHYETEDYYTLNKGHLDKVKQTVDIKPEEVLPFWVILDPGYYGLITQNYYDYDYSFINNAYVNVPTWYSKFNTTIEEILGYNDYKPNQFYLDGLLDLGDSADSPVEPLTLEKIYKMGATNILYKLRSFTKTIIYYRDNFRVGSKDIFYSLEDIKKAKTLNDLNIDIDLYYTEDFRHGRIVFDESILAEDNIQAFIDAPSPIVIYDKLTKEEAPDIFYVEYYRGGAYDDTLITIDPDSPNYLNCNLDGVVLNPNGAIKYFNHYHSALYEDEKFNYFIPYQVRLLNKYIGIHRGPARRFPTLAIIPEKDIYTIVEERNGWGRLKEYPVGWILLNATEPMTGPGQNPDYDVPGAETATIPFKTEVHITKLTIDRLWCYVPEVESWIKSEDISYNQSGKLYNALDLDVIHLNTLDFTKIDSLDKMGIYPNKRVLYFHDREDYIYTGAYTKEAFSNLHELEFVYPESIYNYNCIYYKDNIYDGEEKEIWTPGLGRAKGTGYYFYRTEEADRNDLNPQDLSDGDSFEILKPHFANDKGKELLFIRYAGNEGYISYAPDSLTVEKEPVYERTEVIPSNELGRASFSCSIGDWNPDWDTFISTSWKKNEEGFDVNPQLYRGSALMLDWDYFGFDKNLYRPVGYPEGIYVWNARTWERDKVQFSFEELIRCGTQYVFYPCFDPDTYKIWVYPNDLGGRYEQSHYTAQGHNYIGTDTYYLFNPGIAINYDDPSYKQTTGNFDIYISGEVDNDISDIITSEYRNSDYHTSYRVSSFDTLNLYLSRLSKKGEQTKATIYNQVDTHYSPYTEKTTPTPYSHETNIPVSSQFIYNISNFRKGVSQIVGYGNKYNNAPTNYYYLNKLNKEGTQYEFKKLSDITPIDEVGNIKVGNINRNSRPTYKDICYRDLDIKDGFLRGIIYNTIIYRNFLMVRYWVPVPKGLHYKFNGKDLRIPDNGLFDLLTGDFRRCYKPEDGPIYWAYSLNWGSYVSLNKQCGPAQSYMFLQNQKPLIEDAYNYFDGWQYNTTDIDYIVKSKTEIDTHKHPDKYSTDIRKISPGVVFPVSKLCSDADNKVVGEWYFNGDQWLQSDKVNIYAGEFDKSKMNKLQTSLCLVKPAKAETYYVYADPSVVNSIGDNSGASYGDQIVLPAFYSYVDKKGNKYYFDGSYWVPEKYTSFNTSELNKNYAVVPEKIPYYSQPILNDEYLINYYHYGERLTVPYVCNQDPEWGYTGLGWIRVNSANLSEVI